MGVGTALAVGGALLGGIAQGVGANKAKNAKLKAITQAQGELRGANDTFRTDMAPWRTAGVGALNEQQAMLGLNGQPYDYNKLSDSPMYKFQQEQGFRNIDRQMAKRGLNGSGGQMRAIADYNQGLAGQTFNTRLQQLSALANNGQQATQSIGNAGLNTSGKIADLYIGRGQAKADNYANQSNNIGNLTGQFGQLFSMGG